VTADTNTGSVQLKY